MTSQALSEYDVISNFRTEFSPLVPSKTRFFHNIFISQLIKLKFGTGIQNWMLILIFGSKSGSGDDFGQYDTKTIILRPFFSQTPFRNSIVMAAPKVPGDQKLFERVCYGDSLLRHRALVTRLLSQGYKVDRLSNTIKKFYGRHTDLVGQYRKDVCQMFADSIS